MYRKKTSGLLKHFDFIILDLLCLQASFILAYFIRLGVHNLYNIELYRTMAIAITLIDFTLIAINGTLKNVLKRGYYKEFVTTAKHALLLFLFSVALLYSLKKAEEYSRIVTYVTCSIYFVMTYVVRILWKLFLNKTTIRHKSSLFIVTSSDIAESVIENINKLTYGNYEIAGLAVLDKDMTGEEISGVKVTATMANAAETACKDWVDGVLISMPDGKKVPNEIMDQFLETGITIHVNIARNTKDDDREKIVQKFGEFTVLTMPMAAATTKQLVYKRALDIVGGLVGCIFTILISIIIGPIIFIKSPGNIFFTQTRVGRNGKTFKLYKFRSMYKDAEERKKELMDQNKSEDGFMFKMDFDPRVIGNKILPDGSKKTGIGDFIRRTSLDEFPQFFNVLKGDMSLVGTRPPTVDEWEKYELRHRARLATKPGITGNWQVSGRSDITDFEEVVKLDTSYINEWNIGKDIKILVKTVEVVLKRQGAE